MPQVDLYTDAFVEQFETQYVCSSFLSLHGGQQGADEQRSSQQGKHPGMARHAQRRPQGGPGHRLPPARLARRRR